MNYFTPYAHVFNQQKDLPKRLQAGRNRGGMSRVSKEVNRLLSAAVVSQKFCQLLLRDPAAALAAGFNGETFALSHVDRELVLSIRATTLQGFAEQLVCPPVRVTPEAYAKARNRAEVEPVENGSTLW